jgi:nitrogen fixation protein NifU and related proteins
MSNRALYEQVILEHNKSPRNFHEMEAPDICADGHNPLCGDHFDICLKLKDGMIEEVSFTGQGCAISKSSASIMTTLLKGKTVQEAEAMFVKFHAMITSEPDAPVDDAALGKMAVFAGVRKYPVRIKCATLAWHTMLAALDRKTEPVTTE